MASGNIPQWMRTSSYRNLEKESLSAHRTRMIALVCVLLLFISLSIATACVWEETFHLPYLAACGAAFSILVAHNERLTPRMGMAFWSVPLALNCLMTYLAVKESIDTYKIALAGTILFTGLFALLMLARKEKRLSKAAKWGIMITVLALFATSIFGFDSIPSEGIAAYARMWLFASIAPLIFLLVMTFMVLVAYHKKVVTVPHHKWI